MSISVLVVGGTGMLAPAVRAVAARGDRVMVVARRPHRLGDVTGVTPVRGDWARPAELAAAVRGAAPEPFPVAVAWIHSPYRAAVLDAVADLLTPDAVVVSLHGSAAADPSRTAPPIPPAYVPPRRHRTLVLGFTDAPRGRTRWLTDDEISAAALRALDDPRPYQVAGRVTPWSRRP